MRPQLVPSVPRRRPTLAIVARGCRRQVDAERVIERTTGPMVWREPEGMLSWCRGKLAGNRLLKAVAKLLTR